MLEQEFENAKMEYEETPVPEELNDRVQAGIRQGRANRARRIWKRRLGTVAACFVVVVGALNLSPTVAAAAADVPVLGGLFQVLTVRSYEDPLPEDGSLAKRVDALPPEVSAIIRLRFYEEQSLAEISRILDCPLSTVKTRLYTGLKKLRIQMEGEAI